MKTQTIKKITGREILDSRGNPTIEVDCILSDGSFGRVSIPSGASTGKHEVVELRDGDGKRYGGKGVKKAVKNVNTTIFRALKGKSFTQRELDEVMIALDGTDKKSKLGANAILGVSLAFAVAQARSKNIPIYKYFAQISKSKLPVRMPTPMMNILNGGKHAEKSTDIQEFLIIPHGFKTFSRALQAGVETFHALKGILHDKGFSTTVGDEGGFAPSLKTNEDAIKLIIEAIKKAGYKPGTHISLAIDVAASELYIRGKYRLESEKKILTSDEFTDYFVALVKKYPIISIEDPFDEDDWEGFELFTKKLGKKIQIIGDDLFVTNTERLQKGIDQKAANSILIKLNQIGTVTETIEAINLATKATFTSIISHRSGETEDSIIADFVVGTGAGQIKTGSLSRSDRVAKYNELLRIEEMLGKKAVFSGIKVFKR